MGRDNQKDMKVRDVSIDYEDYDYRTPMKFGGKVVTAVTLLNVTVRAEGRDGNTATGRGSTTMGNIWSFPSDVLGYGDTLEAMRALAVRIRSIVEGCGEYGHPVELMTGLEEDFLKAAEETGGDLGLPEPIPKLCTLVTASPFDAAVHDAYGKLHGVNVYNAYGEGYMNRDLSGYLTDEFKGECLDRYTLRDPKAAMPLYHLVGALDPLTDADVAERVEDGLPNTLPEWIEQDGLTHLKIKLNGNDLDWDVGRVLAVDRVTAGTQKKRGVGEWFYSADFNEKCPNVQYLLDFLRRIKERDAGCFDRIQYIEQPTSRYLKEHMENRMHEAAKLKPVVIDEALVDFEHLQLSMELGYSGVALKTCKGQSQALLMAAAAIKYGLFLCVQDLTLVGASFLHSAGLCARVPTVAAIEGNGRQYCPEANRAWEAEWPGIFRVDGGTLRTGTLTRTGLGHY
ncbi:MAG: hypothetical protein JW909_04735 [Planctomycetes bacterium]|nr:hypothetical protein [Planctomycetota bacterium]